MPADNAGKLDSIELEDVGHTYEARNRRTAAIQAINLSLRPGETVAVCGPSGSGKTTLLLIAAGLMRPSVGHVFWGRRNLDSISDAETSQFRARGVGVGLQNAELVSTLTVLENVALSRIIAHHPQPWDDAVRLLEALQIAHLQDSWPFELSTGERRRVSLARTLLAGSAFVLVDEPTAHLDDESATLVAQTLYRTAENGAGVLIMSHDSRIARQAARLFEIESGQLKECR